MTAAKHRLAIAPIHQVLGQCFHGGTRQFYARKLPSLPFEMKAYAPALSRGPRRTKNSTGFTGDIRRRVSITLEVSISMRRGIFATVLPLDRITPVFRMFARFSSVSICAIIASAIDAP